MGDFGTDNQEKDEKQSQNDKTGLGMEKTQVIFHEKISDELSYSLWDHFLLDKQPDDDQEKSKVRGGSDSTIPDASHKTVTSSTSSDSFPSQRYTCAYPAQSCQDQESEKEFRMRLSKPNREQDVEKQDSTYSIRSTDKVDLEEFDLKSALFSHMNKKKSANKNTTNYRLYHALMEALIADEDAMDKEVADKVKDHKRSMIVMMGEGDDDDEGPFCWIKQKIAGADYSRQDLIPNKEHSEQSSDDYHSRMKRNDSDMEDTDKRSTFQVVDPTWFSDSRSDETCTLNQNGTIPPYDLPEPEHNWAKCITTTFNVLEENKLQRKARMLVVVHQMFADEQEEEALQR
ncbi:hypothetical protein Tco_0152913 [Tanacetum coccineum]